ncbi:MAG: ADP-ribosylglycohydrolase family protein [Rhodospirillales bacterium]|nr:ADP-ribosylglycohydrolase family protein [Rhodospirillales bacterium]
MLGAIAGDIIGSAFEHRSIKTTDFTLFGPGSAATDDSVLTIAVADALMGKRDFAQTIRQYARRYPNAGYGGMFIGWMMDETAGPYNSFGNGSAMRVSPVAWVAKSKAETLKLAAETAAVTHSHPEGIKGAQATALAVWLARQGTSAHEIAQTMTEDFGYDLSVSIKRIRPTYGFDITCQGSVPQALRCALEARSFEEAVRLAVSLGGDADTQACIAGAVAEARFGLPKTIAKKAMTYLTHEQRTIVTQFRQTYA